MTAKAIIGISLVVFILVGLIVLNIKNKKNNAYKGKAFDQPKNKTKEPVKRL